jgi:amidase
MINLLDYSACVVPVTSADKTIEVRDETYVPSCEKDKECWDGYDADLYDGTPVAVQVVARRYQEEKVLTYAEILDEAMKMAESSKLPN